MSTILSIILASSLSVALPSIGSINKPSHEPEFASIEDSPSLEFQNARELLSALATHDESVDSMSGMIRFTNINALENDRKQRIGDLAIIRKEDGTRNYAVSFKTLLIDDRQESVKEHFIFDGRWFVERFPEDKQFTKRELVPVGKTLDPMELMRDAPFWVSLGQDQDRLLKSYDATLCDTNEILVGNLDFPELEHLSKQSHIKDTIQLKLTPKPDSKFVDDWEWVRIWINPETLTPSLYIKSEWTGDLQIVELFGVKNNPEINPEVFDTSSPDARDGWRIQITNWRGQE